MTLDLTKKKCNLCLSWLARVNFYVNKAKPDGLAYTCKSCRKVTDRTRYDEKREEILAQHAAYYRENAEAATIRQRAWYAANREHVSEYVRANRDRRYASTHAYQARKIGAFVDEIDRRIVWIMDQGVCALCHAPADPKNWHLEHHQPLSRGGKHAYLNVGVSHPKCNMQKGTKTLEEWRSSRPEWQAIYEATDGTP